MWCLQNIVIIAIACFVFFVLVLVLICCCFCKCCPIYRWRTSQNKRVYVCTCGVVSDCCASSPEDVSCRIAAGNPINNTRHNMGEVVYTRALDAD